MNIINNIIRKIKLKDKDLEGMYVAVDDLGNIIGFGMDKEEAECMVGEYNLEKHKRGESMYRLQDIKIRKRIKKYL